VGVRIVELTNKNKKCNNIIITSLVGHQNTPPHRCARLGCWPSISRWPCASDGVIGASGEAVEAVALRRRVDVFHRKSMHGGLQPLPHVAT